jgi:hypothetical protein
MVYGAGPVVPGKGDGTRDATLVRMELATVRFPTDSEDADRLAAVAREAAEDPSIRQAEVVEGFGNGLDIKVVLERADGEDDARDAVLRALPDGIRLETLPLEPEDDPFPG